MFVKLPSRELKPILGSAADQCGEAYLAVVL